MNAEKLAEVATRDPLSETTRRERRALLGTGIIGIAIVKTGIVPTQISAIGVTFSQTDQKYLFYILAAVVSYFLIAFLIYALADFIAWRIAYGAVLNAEWETNAKFNLGDSSRILSEPEQYAIQLKAEIEKIKAEAKRQDLLRKMAIDFDIKDINRPNFLIHISPKVSLARAFFEFALPICIGVCALCLLLTHLPK